VQHGQQVFACLIAYQGFGTARAIRADVLYVDLHRETFAWLQERIDRMIGDADRIGTLRWR
jgi:hypothetical protein